MPSFSYTERKSLDFAGAEHLGVPFRPLDIVCVIGLPSGSGKRILP